MEPKSNKIIKAYNKNKRLNDAFYHELRVDKFTKLIRPGLSSAQASVEWLRDPEIGKYMGADFSDISIETEEKRLQDIIDSDDEYNWSIEVNGIIVGNIAIREIKEKTKEFGKKAGLLSILIGDKYLWGKGLATKCESSVLSWAFNEAGFEIISARVLPNNIGSIKALEKTGFKPNGTEPFSDTIEWQKYILEKSTD